MLKKLEILLVEDSPADVRLTEEALKDTDLSYNLTTVNDGEQAMNHLHAEDKAGRHPSVILLDLNMPKKTGHEVLAEMKDEPNLMDIPVIVLTVSQDDEDVLKALHLKMNYYLSKPVNSSRLAALLTAISGLWD